MNDPRMQAEAELGDDEWRSRPVVHVVRKDETPAVTERCHEMGRMVWGDRIHYGTAPGVVCDLIVGHGGPHHDGIDRVWWEAMPAIPCLEGLAP